MSNSECFEKQVLTSCGCKSDELYGLLFSTRPWFPGAFVLSTLTRQETKGISSTGNGKQVHGLFFGVLPVFEEPAYI